MIAREWRCRCSKETLDAFVEHLFETGVRDTQRTCSCRGTQVLQRELDDCVEITLLTYWDSMESMVLFKGEEYKNTQPCPQGKDFGIKPDHQVTHYEVMETLSTHYFPGE
ncbi:antibiotic biosynthesis monooxygenase [Pseudodesulfovibrio sp. zrk46]|uniref:antibiotic biosynthesis monooxygenase n=1 Tax=Pseudodesulfovibrio sp. zrk46 TaxID=2725288 RepID=UPI001449CA43|nr:antibiotic biosynthesis monooxygenase [Pseudodesulfovibrio sp. zrk46]QJB55705.1 antibiotic biosynthesis monooxygenase [Pseudodesulfovibrio sp. zrk46]